MRSQLALLGPLVFLAVSALGAASPAEGAGLSVDASRRCINPLVRKEWLVSLTSFSVRG